MLKRLPDVYVIVFCLIMLAALATWILPGGQYQRRTEIIQGTSKQVLVKDSYRQIEAAPQMLSVFTAPIRGFVRMAEIIAFIFIVGGAFFMLNETGAVSAGIHALVKRLKGREYLVIPLVMFLFSLFGAGFGMCEEAIPFTLIFVPFALALGYDSIVGVCMTFLAAGVGFAGAFFNPFTLQLAQGIAGLDPVSGWEYRLIVWSVVTFLSIAWVMMYAAKIKKYPEKSIMFDLDRERRRQWMEQQSQETRFSMRHAGVLTALVLCLVLMLFGVTRWEWYIPELAGCFLAMGILSAFVGGHTANQMAKNFVAGCKDMAQAALIVCFAGAIIVVLEQGRVMDTILYGMAAAISDLPPMLGADLQYVFQMFLNFFIPSGSTKAALTMPLMAPLADLSGITRQTAVLAYQFGDGFTNMIIPTSPVTVATLGLAKIPFERWFRWNIKMQLMFFGLSILLLIWPVLSGWD